MSQSGYYNVENLESITDRNTTNFKKDFTNNSPNKSKSSTSEHRDSTSRNKYHELSIFPKKSPSKASNEAIHDTITKSPQPK